MTRLIKLPALLVSIALAVTAVACGKTSTTKNVKVEGTKWNVTVNKVIYNIDGEGQYTVADTARMNRGLKTLPHNPEITIGWTIPSADVGFG